MSQELKRIQELTIVDEMLFPDAKSLTGAVERQSAEGFVIRATKSGDTIKYSAVDSEGAPIESKYLQMSDGGIQPSVPDQCFFCVNYHGAWFCTEVLCPEPA